MRRALIITILFISTVPVLVIASTDNLIFNGGFEIPQVPVGIDYVHLGEYLNGENPPLTGWDSYSFYRGVVLFNGSIYEPFNPVPEGFQAVQIEVPGDWISQSFGTVIGQRYTLSFDLSAYSIYGGPGRGNHPCPCETILEVSAGSERETVFGSSEGYINYTLNFTAEAEVTTLRFQNPVEPADWGNYPQIDNVVVTAGFVTVAIDIKPGSPQNSVNRKSKGKIPVAILSTEDFSAPDMVDQGSLTFGHTGNEQSLAFCNIGSQDVNGDGLGDLMCHFYTQLTEFDIDDSEGVLNGKTIDGIPIMGRDTVDIVH